jgi:hypothetical protein
MAIAIFQGFEKDVGQDNFGDRSAQFIFRQHDMAAFGNVKRANEVAISAISVHVIELMKQKSLPTITF